MSWECVYCQCSLFGHNVAHKFNLLRAIIVVVVVVVVVVWECLRLSLALSSSQRVGLEPSTFWGVARGILKSVYELMVVRLWLCTLGMATIVDRTSGITAILFSCHCSLFTNA